MKIWKDRTDTFKKLPTFLDGEYFFRTPTKGNKNKAWTIQVHGPSTIYVVTKGEAVKSKLVGKRSLTESGNPRKDKGDDSSGEKKDESTNGWLKQEGSVVTSSNVGLVKILAKNFEGESINRITLQPIKSDDDWKIIFMTSKIFRILVLYIH